jgi:hypothetical protein
MLNQLIEIKLGKYLNFVHLRDSFDHEGLMLFSRASCMVHLICGYFIATVRFYLRWVDCFLFREREKNVVLIAIGPWYYFFYFIFPFNRYPSRCSDATSSVERVIHLTRERKSSKDACIKSATRNICASYLSL